MELDSRDGKLRVLYGDRLVTLLNEVRQLSSLGYEIPSKIIKCVDIGKKFHQYGVELQAVRSLIHYSYLTNRISSKIRLSS
jgi:dynein heavy chain 2